MTFDERLAERVRRLLPDSDERRMFGGISFLVRGNVACGVIPQGLLVRVDRDSAAHRPDAPHVRPFEMGGRVSRGWLVVEAAGLMRATDLNWWVEAGRRCAASLPPKGAP